MSILAAFLRSLLLTSVLSFTAPLLLVGAILVSLSVAGYIPWLDTFSNTAVAQVLKFLATFGSGEPWHGLMVIGITCGLVGGLFDTYAFYRYQTLRDS